MEPAYQGGFDIYFIYNLNESLSFSMHIYLVL